MSEKLRILILEDNIVDAKTIIKELRKSTSQFKWITVKTKTDFLEKLNKFDPNIILADYSVPEFSGLDALKVVRKSFPDIPFIMITGSLNEEKAVECMREGAWDYVLKEHLIYLNHAVSNCVRTREQKQEAKKNREKIKLMIDNSPIGFSVTDLNGNFTEVNSAFCELLGRTSDEIIGHHFNDFSHPDYNQNNLELNQKLTLGEIDHFSLTKKYIRKDGSIGDVYLRSQLVRDEHGNPLFEMGLSEDITQKLAAEENLKRSEKQFRVLVENLLGIVSIYDLYPDGHREQIFRGPGMEDLVGEELAEKIKKDPKEYVKLVPESDRKKLDLLTDKALESNKRLQAEYRLVIAEDKVKWVLARFHIQILENNIQRWQGIIFDITERKEAQEALQRSEEEFRLLAENLPGFVWIYDQLKDGTYKNIFLGPGLEEILPKDLVKKVTDDPGFFLELIPEEDIKNIDYHSDIAVKSTKQLDVEYRLNLPDKTVKWVRARFGVTIQDNGLLRWQGVLFDITENKLTSQALIRSEELFKMFMDRFPAAIFIKDLDHRLVYSNKYLIDNFLGEDKIGSITHDIFPKEIANQMVEKEIEALNKGIAEFEQEVKDINQADRIFKTLLFSVNVEDGETMIGGFSSDITEEKKIRKEIVANRDKLEELVEERTSKLQESSQILEDSRTALTYLLEDVNSAREELVESNRKLEFSNKELEAFAHSVSHDLRAPLRHINGFIELLFEHLSDNVDNLALEYFQNIRESSENMGKLIEQLLVFSRMGRVTLNKVKIDHNDIIDEALKLVENDRQNREINLDIDNLGTVFGDPFLLRQVWVNLLSNAMKYTSNRKKAVIKIGKELRKEGDENKTYYYIKDNGVGFDNKFVEKAFQVFQRLHSATEYHGIGVGLANVSRIIQRHGGSISAEAKIDKGAKFFFTLPGE